MKIKFKYKTQLKFVDSHWAHQVRFFSSYFNVLAVILVYHWNMSYQFLLLLTFWLIWSLMWAYITKMCFHIEKYLTPLEKVIFALTDTLHWPRHSCLSGVQNSGKLSLAKHKVTDWIKDQQFSVHGCVSGQTDRAVRGVRFFLETFLVLVFKIKVKGEVEVYLENWQQ